MRRSLIDVIKGLFHSQISDAEPVQARIENARMSSTRLKALKPVDFPTEAKFPEAAQVPDPNDPQTISKRVKTLADMSHYRLEAYVATLPVERTEHAEDMAVNA